MKRIQYHRYGGPEQMHLEDFLLTPPGEGEVAVKVKFAAINPIDWKLRDGQMKIITGNRFPRAMGMDFSGVVISVGKGVVRFKEGDPVFGIAPLKECGALGQAVIARETALAQKPEDVSFEEAACLGTPGVTAWNGLIDKAGLRPGQHVFINGCAGAVGAAAVQIARLFDAKVSGSCSPEDMAYARSLGVSDVFNYRTIDPSKFAGHFDIVYDTAATMSVATGISMLRRGGLFLDLNPNPGKFIRSMVNWRLKPVVCRPRPAVLESLAKAVRENRFSVRVGETVALINAIELITEIEKGRKLAGKGLVAME